MNNLNKIDVVKNVSNDCAQSTNSMTVFEPFKGLPDIVLSSLHEMADFRHYNEGETIFSMGQYDGAEIYLPVKGEVSLMFTDPNSGSVYMETIEPGNVFGLDILLSDQQDDGRDYVTLTATLSTDVWIIDGFEFEKLLSNRPSLAKVILPYLAHQLVKTRFRSFEIDSAPEQKIYALLLTYVSRDEITGGWTIPKLPKHREISGELEIEEAIVADSIAHLIQSDVAQRAYPGLIILDMERLEHLAQ